MTPSRPLDTGNPGTGFEPRFPGYAQRVQDSFARQAFMATLGAKLQRIAPGQVEILLPFRPELGQQHGFMHAGATISVLDSAAGYAALSLFPETVGVLTTELKVNLLAPVQGAELIAVGRVIKPGRTLSICQSDVFDRRGPGQDVHVATALLSMMAKEGLRD